MREPPFGGMENRVKAPSEQRQLGGLASKNFHVLRGRRYFFGWAATKKYKKMSAFKN